MNGSKVPIGAGRGLTSTNLLALGYHYCFFTFPQFLDAISTLDRLYSLLWKICRRQKKAYRCNFLKNGIVYLFFSRNIHFLV